MNKVDSIIVDRNYIIYAIEQWGSPISVSLLDPTCSLFKVPEHDGLIGYRQVGSCTVVFGEPVCPQEHMAELMHAFKQHCAQKSNNVIYIAVSEQFNRCAFERAHAQASLNLLYEITLNPMEDPTARHGKKASLLRNKYNQSIRNGITVHEYVGHDLALEKKIEAVVVAWQSARKGLQLHLHLGELFQNSISRRWFYAQQGEHIIGVAILDKIGGPSAWLLTLSAILPGALLCTSEFMLLRILETLRAERCTYFSIGPSVASELCGVIGFGRLKTLFARGIFYLVINKMLRLHKRHRYWDKFHPEKRPLYLLFDKPRVGAAEVMSIIRALSAHS